MSIHDFTDAGREPGDTSGLSRFAAAIGSRLVGPGGYYNLGNGLGLVTGVTVQIVAVPPGSALSGHAALLDYFVGSIAALSLTMATLVFFWSGEIYCRAWARKPPPDASLNRLGDMLSGVGAIGLGIALQQAWSGASWVLVAAPLTLLVCYLLWAKADLLLLLQEVRAGSALASSSGNRRDGA